MESRRRYERSPTTSCPSPPRTPVRPAIRGVETSKWRAAVVILRLLHISVFPLTGAGSSDELWRISSPLTGSFIPVSTTGGTASYQ